MKDLLSSGVRGLAVVWVSFNKEGAEELHRLVPGPGVLYIALYSWKMDLVSKENVSYLLKTERAAGWPLTKGRVWF